MPSKKIFLQNQGFTLTEVFVTIAIIGIIAALTIPGAVQSIQDDQYKIAYKKAFSVANLAISKAHSDGVLRPMTANSDASAMHFNFNAFKNQFNVAKLCFNNDNEQCWDYSGEFITSPGNRPKSSCHAFMDNSGMAWTMYSEISSGEALIMADTNGFKPPNRYGKDRWFFKFVDENGSRSSGIPIKALTYHSTDLTSSGWSCHYPPCYLVSWLTGAK